MAARHRHYKAGGSAGQFDSYPAPKKDFDEDAGVEKDAEGKKHGGKVRAKHKHGGHVADGKAAKHRLDRPRPGRMSGGRCGSDKAPLSSANKAKMPEGRSGLVSSEEGG